MHEDTKVVKRTVMFGKSYVWISRNGRLELWVDHAQRALFALEEARHNRRWTVSARLLHTGRPSRLPFRAALVSASVATVAALAVALPTSADETPDAWPSMGTVPVVMEETSSPSPYRPEPRPTSHTTRAGERSTLKPTPSPSPTERVAKPKATPATKHPIAKPPADIRISFYRNCTGFAQSCIDDGHLTMYGGRILAGHNYMGYQWLSRVAVGRTVRVIYGPLAGTYRVYGHMRINRQGGAIPDFGGAALVLQSCEGSGTGFSLLKRV
jgi:hypothetical protein